MPYKTGANKRGFNPSPNGERIFSIGPLCRFVSTSRLLWNYEYDIPMESCFKDLSKETISV